MHKCDIIIYNEFIVRTDADICTFIASFYDNTWIEIFTFFYIYNFAIIIHLPNTINFIIKNETTYDINKFKYLNSIQ